MTFHRAGWITDRPFAVIAEADDGSSVAFVCLKCFVETIPEPEAFARHLCHKTKKRVSENA